MDGKTENQWGWLYVLPVVVLVAFNAVIPLMAVVNYSTQETFGNNVFFFEGVKWFEQVLHSDRFHVRCGLACKVEPPKIAAIHANVKEMGKARRIEHRRTVL